MEKVVCFINYKLRFNDGKRGRSLSFFYFKKMFSIFNTPTPKQQVLVDEYIQRNLNEFLNPTRECRKDTVSVSVANNQQLSYS